MPPHVASRPCIDLRGVVRGMVARTPLLRLQTGLAHLDRLLEGGLPRGAVTELVGPPSSGRTALAYAALSAVTAAGGLAACIDLPDAFDPEHADAAGVALARVLWVRPRDSYGAFRAAEHIVGAEGFSLVLVDLDASSAARKQVSAGTWLRLARAAERSRTAVVVLSAHRSADAFPAVRLETQRRRTGFTGEDRPCPLFDGIISAVHLRKNKLGASVGRSVSLFAAVTA